MDQWLLAKKGSVLDTRKGPIEPIAKSTNVWDLHGLTIIYNSGAGNCGPLAVASALSRRLPEKYGGLTGTDVRAAVIAEMLAKPGRYALCIAGCTFRHNNMAPNPGPIEVIDELQGGGRMPG